MADLVDAFFAGASFAVVGASNDRQKFGNKVLRCYWRFGLTAWPVNPARAEVEGATCFPTLDALPHKPHGVSLITPPNVSATIVRDAIALGVERLWFQPGAEDRHAIELAREAGLTVIAGGACVLVELPRRQRA